MNDMDPGELKSVALGIHRNEIFTNRHLSENEDIYMVFVGLGLLSGKQFKKIKDDPPGLIYEYMSAALPRSINGHPVFMSFRLLSVHDTREVVKIVARLRESEKEALGEVEKRIGFVTYENRNNPHITVHKEGCRQIAKRGGVHTTGRGKYATHISYGNALVHAAETGLPLKNCSFCKPAI